MNKKSLSPITNNKVVLALLFIFKILMNKYDMKNAAHLPIVVLSPALSYALNAT